MTQIIDNDLNVFLLDKLMPLLPAYIRHGNLLSFRCPICGDSKKNTTKRRGALYISPKVGYHCFNCNIDLSGFKFLQMLAGESFKDIMTEYKRRRLSAFTSTQTTTVAEEQKIKGAVPDLTPLTQDEYSYLFNRKIVQLPCFESIQLKNATINGNNFIFIPWLNHNKLNSFQLHNYTKVKGIPKYVFQKHADKGVYGIDTIDQKFKYIICFEGVYDSLFVKNGVAIGGTNLMPSQERELKTRYPKHEIVLAFDADSAGLLATSKYITANASQYKYFIWYDSAKYKDVNNLIIETDNINKFSTDAIQSMIFTGIEARFELSKNNLWPT